MYSWCILELGHQQSNQSNLEVSWQHLPTTSTPLWRWVCGLPHVHASQYNCSGNKPNWESFAGKHSHYIQKWRVTFKLQKGKVLQCLESALLLSLYSGWPLWPTLVADSPRRAWATLLDMLLGPNLKWKLSGIQSYWDRAYDSAAWVFLWRWSQRPFCFPSTSWRTSQSRWALGNLSAWQVALQTRHCDETWNCWGPVCNVLLSWCNRKWETSLNGKCLRLSLSFRLFGNVVADELTVGVAISVKFMLKNDGWIVCNATQIHNFAIYSRRYGRVGMWSGAMQI